MSYKVVFYNHRMNEICRTELDDPKPTGRQLLARAGYRDPREHRVMVLGSDHQLEDIDLEETVDVSESGKAQFILFPNSDRSFNFILDTQRQPWGAEDISETMLRTLAGVNEEFRVWLGRARSGKGRRATGTWAGRGLGRRRSGAILHG